MSTATAPSRSRLRRVLGLGLLLAVAGGLLAWQLTAGAAPTVVAGPVGGEKVAFLEDPQIQEILRDEYGLEVDFRREGSIDMVRNVNPEDEFLWPSSQVALAIYEGENGSVEDVNIFNSPIVLYSWGRVTDALVAEDLASQEDGIYRVDLMGLAETIEAERPWSDLGLDGLFGTVVVQTTDPNRSNSGNQFTGLLANTLNGGAVVNADSVGAIGPRVASIYDRLGVLEDSSGDLFNSFLQTGEGSRPIIVGYENQLMEFGLANERYRQALQDQVRILYPEPTVWSEHPLIPRNEDGERLRDALQDEDIRRLAWERHGFRAATVSGEEDPDDLAVDFAGIPRTIDSVIQMPAPDVMQTLTDGIAG